ncbi:hypothetical protein WJX84_004291 [Apatococcus fuscideae]|uniref:Uncharacterized protein n=1 Tax=Apatococcus fuscideae TaxID=2026836 RepID=A0AAW1TAX1_9CHLO
MQGAFQQSIQGAGANSLEDTQPLPKEVELPRGPPLRTAKKGSKPAARTGTFTKKGQPKPARGNPKLTDWTQDQLTSASKPASEAEPIQPSSSRQPSPPEPGSSQLDREEDPMPSDTEDDVPLAHRRNPPARKRKASADADCQEEGTAAESEKEDTAPSGKKKKKKRAKTKAQAIEAKAEKMAGF